VVEVQSAVHEAGVVSGHVLHVDLHVGAAALSESGDVEVAPAPPR
jgi:hypothetical protein